MLLCSVLLVLFLCLLLRRCRQRQAVSADSFTNMPGPVPYPVLGTTYLYMQGKYSWDRYMLLMLLMHHMHHMYSIHRLHHTGLSKYCEYGPVVREQLLPGVNIVWLFHPQVIIEFSFA